MGCQCDRAGRRFAGKRRPRQILQWRSAGKPPIYARSFYRCAAGFSVFGPAGSGCVAGDCSAPATDRADQGMDPRRSLRIWKG